MSSPARRVRDRPAWRVSIPAHTIRAQAIGGSPRPGRYVIIPSERIQFEGSRRVAIVMAVTAAHVEAGVPCWRPYLRETARRCTVDRIMATAAGGGQ